MDMTACWPITGPGQKEAPCLSPILGMHPLPTVPTVGDGFKDAALRE